MNRNLGRNDFFNLGFAENDCYKYYRGNIEGKSYSINIDKDHDALLTAIQKRNQIYKKTGYMPSQLKVRKIEGRIWYSDYSHRGIEYYRIGLRDLETRKYFIRNVRIETPSGNKEERKARRISKKNTKEFNQIVDIYHNLIRSNFEQVCDQEEQDREPLLHKLVENKDLFWDVAYKQYLSLTNKK
jgi:hypothetical protein